MIKIPLCLKKLSDDETIRHSYRVAYLAESFGKHLYYPEIIQCRLFDGGLLHDIGKQKIPSDILYKKQELNSEEMSLIKRHVEVDSIPIPLDWLHPDVQEIIFQHHEKYDGTGYPQQLIGENINLLAQIVALCDVFDAITSKRCYHQAGTKENAISYIQTQMGTQFEVSLAEKFCEFVLSLSDSMFE